MLLKLVETFRLGNVMKAMAPHSSAPAWKIPWMEEPGGLQSIGHVELDTTEETEHARTQVYQVSSYLYQPGG